MHRPPSPAPATARRPRTLLGPPARRPSDRGSLLGRLVFVVMQAGICVAVNPFTAHDYVQLGELWLTFLLGPLAEVVPAGWTRLASSLRILQ